MGWFIRYGTAGSFRGYKMAPKLTFTISLFFIVLLYHPHLSPPRSYDMRVTTVGIAVGCWAVGALAKEKAVDMSRHGKTSAAAHC